MTEHVKPIVSRHNAESGSLKSYVAGFALSVAFTLAAYWLVVRHELTDRVIVILIVAFALMQFMIQLVFFLHLGKETKPRWKLFVFIFMILVVAILVFGSLWIMSNLNYRMTPEQMNAYMNSQGGF